VNDVNDTDASHKSHDPFVVLRGGELPAPPDPAFAAGLRRRLESAVSFFEAQPNRTQGVVMSGTDTAITGLSEPTATVPIQHGDIGYVSVWTPDADRAAVFYGHVLGWTYDAVTHQVTNTHQHIGIYSAAGPQGMLCCYAVTDLDGARQSILDGGGSVGEAQKFSFGTVLDATDPAGTAFAVFRPSAGTPRPALNGEGPGEVSYLTHQVADSAAFRAFYSRVLFWTFEPGHIEDGWQVQGTHPMAGVAGGSAHAVVVPMWTVADVEAAVARVREAGGNVIEEPSQQPYGRSALCTDDQGTRFYLGEL
jgi:predicted enzyme related to lactoylglutathione lyase